MTLATCIGCGCDDNHACPDGCYWLRLDRAEGLGVCSECDDHLDPWDRGDRTMHAQPAAEIESELAAPPARIPNPPRAPRKNAQGLCDHDWPFTDVDDADTCRSCGMGFTRHIFTELP